MDNPFEFLRIETKDPNHIKIAYALMGLGLLGLLRKPSRVAALAGGYLLFDNLVTRAKAAIK